MSILAVPDLFFEGAYPSEADLAFSACLYIMFTDEFWSILCLGSHGQVIRHLSQHRIVLQTTLVGPLLGPILQNLITHITIHVQRAHFLRHILLCALIQLLLLLLQFLLQNLLLSHHLCLLAMREFALLSLVTTTILVVNTRIVFRIITFRHRRLLQCRAQHRQLLSTAFGLFLQARNISLRLYLLVRLRVLYGRISTVLNLLLHLLHILLDLLRLILILQTKSRILYYILSLLLNSLTTSRLSLFRWHL